MESNWRLNVAIGGMSHSDWRLAARLRVLPSVVITNPAPGDNRPRLWTGVSIPGSLPTFAAFVPFVATHPHFPYGWDVDPD